MVYGSSQVILMFFPAGMLSVELSLTCFWMLMVVSTPSGGFVHGLLERFCASGVGDGVANGVVD